jgi:hypothetical protein
MSPRKEKKISKTNSESSILDTKRFSSAKPASKESEKNASKFIQNMM